MKEGCFVRFDYSSLFHPLSLISSFMTPERYEQIGKLYQAALERPPALRSDFIAAACGYDEALRGEVEALLAAHAEAEHFMEQPPNDVAAGWQVAAVPLVQYSFAHYQMRALLGKGGMGEVWLAEDTQLGRQIAVKLLPAEFTTNPERVRRFAQEARTASALNHPNIITIHEIGQTPAEAGDTHYIVTEYIEGETLRQHLTNLPESRLQPAAAVEIAAQIAAALAAAHQAGIVHRDIKPENVMLRHDGIVKVLDFGLAKLTEPAAVDPLAATVVGGSTDSGLVLGTPRYMSPEQARGERVDARTDIFSLGVLLYEMVTGRPPFAGATMSEVIAAILRDEPPPLAEAAPDTPSKLAHIISRALRKDRTERYQGAKDLLDELQQLKEQLLLERLASTPTGDSVRSRTLPSAEISTNKRRRAMLTALAAIIVVSAVLAGWVYFKRAPGLTSKDTILLADFENRTGEAIFDQMLKQGLAIQLQQSPFLHLLPEAQVRHQLKLMKRAPNQRVTAELAREICERQNLKALIAGSLAPLGSHYVITLEALNGQTGETLAHEQVEAENKEQVLRALSQAATRLREKLGESLSSIRRFDRPLQEGTTAKPEAFKAYSQGTELAVGGRLAEAIPFLQRAVELDPEFAHAYSQMAIMYWVTDRPGRAAGYAKKSYELKERAGELEKFRITHKYHQIATGDLNKAIEVLRLQRRTYPREWTGPNDLAVVHYLLGQSEQAVAEARESIRLNSNFSAPYRWLAIALLHLNRFAEAKEVLAQAIQQGLDHRDVHLFLYQLAFINGDTVGMQQQLDWAHGKPDEYVAFDWQAQAAAFTGQGRQAQDFSRRAVDLAVRGDAKEVAARYATEQALRDALSGACKSAKTAAAQGLKLARGRASLPRAALALALCGEATQARPLIEELSKLYPEDTLINELWLPSISAALELQKGNAAQALQQLQTAARYEAAAEFWPQYLRGQAHLKLKQGTAAAAEFQKILDHRGYAPLSPLYSLAQAELAHTQR
jgi:eukaryotic-like serine/threonine-protein kinase